MSGRSSGSAEASVTRPAEWCSRRWSETGSIGGRPGTRTLGRMKTWRSGTKCDGSLLRDQPDLGDDIVLAQLRRAPEGHVHHGMIPMVLTHAVETVDDRDPDPSERGLRPDARTASAAAASGTRRPQRPPRRPRRSPVRPGVASSTPRTRVPSSTRRVAVVSARIARFGRRRAGSRYATAVDCRTPSRMLYGEAQIPNGSGTLRSGHSGSPRSRAASISARTGGSAGSSSLNPRWSASGPPMPWIGLSGKSGSSSMARIRGSSAS